MTRNTKLKVDELKYKNAVYSNNESRKFAKPFNNPKTPVELVRLVKKLIKMKPALSKYNVDVNESYESLNKNPAEPKRIAEEAFLNDLKTFASEKGISDIGYAILSSELLYKGSVALYPNAIVLAMEMDQEEIEKSPSIETQDMIHRTYSELNGVTNEIANFIRSKGFGAHAGLSAGDLICNYPELAVKAGIGYRGRSGNLIMAKSGPRVRLSVVLTSIENLDFCGENPHKWIKEFCAKCGQCIRKCPQGAITLPDGNDEIHEYKHLDSGKCASETGCADCMKVCPFNKLPYEKIKSNFNKNQ